MAKTYTFIGNPFSKQLFVKSNFATVFRSRRFILYIHRHTNWSRYRTWKKLLSRCRYAFGYKPSRLPILFLILFAEKASGRDASQKRFHGMKVIDANHPPSPDVTSTFWVRTERVCVTLWIMKCPRSIIGQSWRIGNCLVNVYCT